MSQYFLNCLKCAQSLELEDEQELNFFPALDCDFSKLDTAFMEPGIFLLLHRGHPLMFTTKE